MQVFIDMMTVAGKDWQSALLYCVISCCVAIFLTGSFKLAVLGKIPNKRVKKLVCFLSGMFMTAGSAALYRVCEGGSFKYYLPSLAILIPVEIVLYQLYENTLLRDGIDAIGSAFVHKLLPVVFGAIANGTDKKEAKVQLISATAAAKANAAKEIKKLAERELKNL